MNSNMPIETVPQARSASLRIRRRDFDALRAHLTSDPETEQLAFVLAEPVSTTDGTVLIVRKVFFPDQHDLSEQTGTRIAPTREFQAAAYLVAEQCRLAIIDVHTHTIRARPQFSEVDRLEFARNSAYITERFEARMPHGMIVFNNACDAFDGVLCEGNAAHSCSFARVEILGRPMEILTRKERATGHPDGDALFARHRLVPEWDQARVARPNITVVGLGGNGAHVLEALIALGAGTVGWIAGIDDDILEPSNIPRIPYATTGDVGRSKVLVAADFVRARNGYVQFRPLHCDVRDERASDAMKSAHIIFGCGDNDGLRKVVNEFSVGYDVLFVDLGCSIEVNSDGIEAGGQVRVVIPGETPCLVCCGGFDAGQAALELLDPASRDRFRRHGYVVGNRHIPTPSVASLNALTAQLGIRALLGLIDRRFKAWSYTHVDWLSGEVITANGTPHPACPVCGTHAFECESGTFAHRPIEQSPEFSTSKLGITEPFNEDLR